MTRPLPPLSSFQRNNLPQDWAAVEADLARFQERFPELALLAVLHQPASYSDALLAELQACASEPQKRTDDAEGWMLHLYAMHLLATLRDTRAFVPLLGIARLDGAACSGGSRKCSYGSGYERTPTECRDASFRPWHR